MPIRKQEMSGIWPRGPEVQRPSVPTSVWELFNEVQYQLFIIQETKADLQCNLYFRAGVGRIWARCPFLEMKFYWNITTPFCLYIVGGSRVEHLGQRPQGFQSLKDLLIKKELLTLPTGTQSVLPGPVAVERQFLDPPQTC